MPKKLLLADDSVVIQKLVGLSFANEDVELTTTDNGDDAIARAREVKPDLILADVVMPGKSGYEVCEAIKADPELQQIPVLLLTGTFEAFDENRARTAGSDGHITKPFEAQSLVDRVGELLSRPPAAPPLATTAPNLDGPAVTQIRTGTENSDSFEFFDDGVQSLADSSADFAQPNVAAPPPMPATPSPLAETAEPPPVQMDSAAPAGELPPLAPSSVSPIAETPASEPESLMPDPAPAATPPIDDLSFDAIEPPSLPDAPLEPSVGDDATTIHLDVDDGPMSDVQTGVGDAPTAWNDDLDIAPEPIRETAPDVTQLADDLFPDATAQAPVADLDAVLPPEVPVAAPPVISGGDQATDSIAFGQAPATDAPPDPMQTMLADDLFSDAPPVAAVTHMPSDLDLEAPAVATAPPQDMADDFDVSSSDLDQSIPAMPDLDLSPPAPVETPTANEAPADADEFSVSEGLLGGAPTPPTEAPVAEAVVDATSADAATPDLSPIMRDRVHETLERVAWEAFSDLSDTVVKQVVEKVEQVAWEVIPQMAEAIIKEEIRRMKGENDE